MSVTTPTHTLIAELVALVQGFLPADYHLGYELIHTNVSDADRLRADHEIKARWRDRLGQAAERGKRGASDDLAALPADAETVTEADVLFEILHLPTGLSVVRTVPMADLITAANAWQSANANQRKNIEAQVQKYLRDFYALCEARVAARVGSP